MNFTAGEYIYINKPYRMTSFGALAFVRTRVSRKVGVKRVKIGHAGTLDPLATGVLILCTGKKATTPSYDMEHEVDQTYPTAHITREMIERVLAGFVGDIQQVPPEYSACKIGGDRAYELMRKGRDVELAAKTIHIDSVDVLDFNPTTMQLSIRVVCGKGTYIRSLARDIGRALDSGAYLTALCRTRVGDVRIEDCITIDDFPAWLEKVNIEFKDQSSKII